MIAEYLTVLDIHISLTEFKNLLKNEKLILLLDGLDEAIKIAPFLPLEIQKMSLQYKNVQFILTSRMYGAYASIIPFFAVTLLPFTDDQRDDFISKWFKNEVDGKNKINKIKKHFVVNDAISEIVRNPLLCTTLCVLAQYNISLPKSEIRMYDERLRLLTGYYDNVKHIVTRIKSVPSNLEIVAQKLAFYLHKNIKRDEHIDILKLKAKTLLQNKLDSREIELAILELMHPCEILVPMSPDGKYGFGHLRFQEHLAAKELMNRNIGIISLLEQVWWKGALKLFVQMNDNIEWLIDEVVAFGKTRLPIVKELIDSRHKVEREKLKHLINDFLLMNFGNDGTDDESLDVYLEEDDDIGLQDES
jgi:predicted NACHT family NTPase